MTDKEASEAVLKTVYMITMAGTVLYVASILIFVL